jgi:hypothetical protein
MNPCWTEEAVTIRMAEPRAAAGKIESWKKARNPQRSAPKRSVDLIDRGIGDLTVVGTDDPIGYDAMDHQSGSTGGC